MHPQGRTVDAGVARLASASDGVVTRAQLLAAGATAAEIRSRMRRGTLIRAHRGVYRVGHRAPSVEARYLAAVWAGGEGALLCGLAAASLLALVSGGAPLAIDIFDAAPVLPRSTKASSDESLTPPVSG